MKNTLLLAVLAVAFVAVLADDGDEQLFRKFIVQHKKVYHASEFQQRFENFKANLRRIDELNNNPRQHATFAVNKFSDFTPEEFAALYKLPKFDPSKICIWPFHAEVPDEKMANVPTEFDWRTKGAVTPVKNQQQCGSCWTFSTTGNIEGQWKLWSPKHNLVGLSEQWIVDCSNSCLASEPQLCNAGCGGGLPWLAYEDIIKNKGLESEAAFGYTGEDGNCPGKGVPSAVISNWTALSSNFSQITAFMYQQGPLSITMNADILMSYSSGIITGTQSDCPVTGSDHAILLVGYGYNTTIDSQFWTVKNSWGADWGEDGYFRIQSNDGLCGINACVTTTVVHFH